MDDDAVVLKVVSRLARSLGYQCTCVEEGAMAIETYAEAEAQGTPFDIVIMDFIAQVQAHLISHQYDSLMKKANLKSYGRSGVVRRG